MVNLPAGRVATELKAAPGLVSAMSTGRQVVAAIAGAPLSVWNTESNWKLDRVIGSETDPASPLSDRITALAFSPNGQTLAVGSGPASRFGDVKLFKVTDGAMTRDLGEVHSDTVLDMAFSPDGSQLATAVLTSWFVSLICRRVNNVYRWKVTRITSWLLLGKTAAMFWHRRVLMAL